MLPFNENKTGAETQFVYHNFFEDNETLLAATVSQITEEGLWCPVNYSIISPDIFFFGGGIPGAITVICATPHKRSTEDVGMLHLWKKVRLMEPDGEIYSLEDDTIPANVRRVFVEQLNTGRLAKKGFRHIPRKDIKAIIAWGEEGRNFRWACNYGLAQYIKGQATEPAAVIIIESFLSNIPMTMEIFDPNYSKEEVVAGIAKSVIRFWITENREETLQAPDQI